MTTALMVLPKVEESEESQTVFYRKEWTDRTGQRWRLGMWRVGSLKGMTILECDSMRRYASRHQTPVGQEEIFYRIPDWALPRFQL